jgi:RNA polymerase sigma-70 factor (ECF subfamily)
MNSSTATATTPVYDTATLYRDYSGKVNRWATRLARSSIDADDIVQEVFLAAHRLLPSIDHVRSPAGWLLKITQNIARHLWRSRARSAVREASCDPGMLPSPTPSPLEHLERRRAVEQLDQAVAGLDPRYRQVYLLCEIKRMPCAKVAALTGLSAETLRVQRFRARLKVAKRLGELSGTKKKSKPAKE